MKLDIVKVLTRADEHSKQLRGRPIDSRQIKALAMALVECINEEAEKEVHSVPETLPQH